MCANLISVYHLYVFISLTNFLYKRVHYNSQKHLKKLKRIYDVFNLFFQKRIYDLNDAIVQLHELGILSTNLLITYCIILKQEKQA